MSRRRWRRRRDRRDAALAVAGGLVLAVVMHAGTHPAGASPAPSGTAAAAIAYAKAQIGKPYAYGATGPDAYDCSGLVMAAYASAGVSIERTSEEQWASEPHVSDPEPGDLVYFTGSPIDPPPGHVGLVVGPHLMIDAYGSGVPVQEQSFGLPDSAPGLADPWGYTRPWGSP
jgi:peptidoglycan DL-endopeptidase CwlO